MYNPINELIKNIENFGAGDLINIKKNNNKDILVPMNDENIKSIDLKNKKIILDPIKGLIN